MRCRAMWTAAAVLSLLVIAVAAAPFAGRSAVAWAGAAPRSSEAQPWPFADVSPDSPGAAAVLDLYQRGIVQGVGDHRFLPDSQVGRAAFVKMLLLAAGIHPASGAASPSAANPFPDVPADFWARSYITAAWRLGVVKGDATGHFRPKDPVTTEEMATLAWRLRDLVRTSAPAPKAADAERIDSWAEPAVALAVQEGLLEPDAKHLLHPRAPASRLAAARFADNLAQWADEAHKDDTTVSSDGRSFPVLSSWTMRATAYSHSEPGIGTRTASGLHVRVGIVAVDPKLIPLGSLVYVEGYGFAVAADTGGAIKGRRIDLYLDAPVKTVAAFGIQKRKVYLLAEPH